MKSLIIFDSAFGNTQKIAEIIAAELDASAIKAKDFKAEELTSTDLLIVGSPINGWKPLPTVSTFLNSLEHGALKGIKATSFDTRVKLFIHGDAKDKIAKDLKAAGAEIIAPPQAFYVKGSEGPLLENELENARVWADRIKSSL